jgi:TraU protein
VVVLPRPPSSKPDVGTRILDAGVVFGGTVLLTEGATPPPLPQLPNLGCVSWKVTGACLCNPFTPCLTVEYHEPGWLIETVLKPGTTALSELAPFLDAALQAGGTALPGGGGAGNAPGSGHTNLQYMEAHVYTLPQPLGGPCTSCAPSPQLPLINYASELDAVTWRTAAAVPSPLDLITQIGTWGRLYPRGGKSIHGSKPVASGLTAARALDIAFQPIGTPPNVDAHVVIAPTGGFSRCFQMAWPKQTPCMPAGTPPPLWETASVSPRGTYIWIAWRRRQCCINPNQSTCGITLPGIGGHGENWCILDSPPAP